MTKQVITHSIKVCIGSADDLYILEEVILIKFCSLLHKLMNPAAIPARPDVQGLHTPSKDSDNSNDSPNSVLRTWYTLLAFPLAKLIYLLILLFFLQPRHTSSLLSSVDSPESMLQNSNS